MKYSKDTFSVPALSLSGSRARRQMNTIPTKDCLTATYTSINQNNINLQNGYAPYHFNNSLNPQDKARRPPIFPPKSTPIQIENSRNLTVEMSSNNLNKNVYLQKKEEQTAAIEVNVRPTQKQRNVFTGESSFRDMLSGPIGDHLTHQREKNLERKRDINRVLFDRKLNKLFEEASLYEQELLSQGKDELGPHIQQLQKIKDTNLCGYRTILSGLNALIQ